MNSITSSHNISKRTAATAASPIVDYIEAVPIASTRINLALFVIGALITIYAYSSLSPVLATGVFYGVTYLLLLLPVLGGVYERNIFTRIFAVGFVMAGVAAIYANHFQDEGQLYSDASSFFEMAAGHARGLSLNDLKVIHEGSLAIVVWAAFYDFFAALGFPRERYIGVTVNVTAVALTAVVALKMARQVYGNDPYRFKRLTLLFSGCGLFWLFAGIHLRDSVVLLAVTTLAYVWVYFLKRPAFGWRLLQLVVFSLLTLLFFEFLRAEFLLVPVALALSGLAAFMIGQKTQQNSVITYMLMLVGLVVVAGLLMNVGDFFQEALSGGQKGYLDSALDQSSADSLGMGLIVNQPMPIRLSLGAIYLLVYPIPFWVGFQIESAYTLFKSFNAVFFYLLIPLLVVTMRQLWRNRAQRTPPILFMLFTFIGFTLAVAGTSLETRHFGAFLAPLFVLVLQPDLRVLAVRQDYEKLLIGMLGGVAIVHGAWIFLKLA